MKCNYAAVCTIAGILSTFTAISFFAYKQIACLRAENAQLHEEYRNQLSENIMLREIWKRKTTSSPLEQK